ncbi:MAG TPA: hypothetical protein ENI76_06135 [Ignavibacteria bacterium]|nr:hypothetical protein [Ignavibacteria bacterium]
MFEIEDIKLLYKKAEGHNLYYDEINEETRKVEAFLIQSALLEGILCEIASKITKNKVPAIHTKRRDSYGLNSAIDDLYLLKIITEKEFIVLDNFRKARNNYFHNLLKQDPKKLENKLGKEYDNFEEITWGMVKKLEKLYNK